MVIHLTVMTSGMPCAKSRFIPYGMADKSFCIVEIVGHVRRILRSQKGPGCHSRQTQGLTGNPESL